MTSYRSLLEVLKFSSERDILRHQGQVSGLWRTTSGSEELWAFFSDLLGFPSRLQGESSLQSYQRSHRELSVLGLVGTMDIIVVNCWERTRKALVSLVEGRDGRRQATWVFVPPASFVASGGMGSGYGHHRKPHLASNAVQLFDESKKTALPTLSNGRWEHRGVAVKGVVYLFGGTFTREADPISSAECLNLSNTGAGWMSLPDLPYPQCQPCICSTPSHIYLCLTTSNRQVLIQYQIASELYTELPLALPAIARPSTFAASVSGLVLLAASGQREVLVHVNLEKNTVEVADASDELPKKKECQGLVIGQTLFIGYAKWVFKYNLITKVTELLQLH